jgi:O-antigen/teichoic acid export membrane protein
LIVLALLGDTEVAEYYISFSIVGLVSIVPMSLSTSLYVEGSHGEDLRANARRVVVTSFAIITPMVFVLSILAGPVLALFGGNYKDATDLMRVLLMSSYFVAAYYIFTSIQNVKLEPGIIVVVSLLRFALIMVTSYMLILSFGALGIGYAWVLSHAIVVLAILVVARREKWI